MTAHDRFREFVERLAAEKKCEEVPLTAPEPQRCHFSSGPYCDVHGIGELESWIDEARALVEGDT